MATRLDIERWQIVEQTGQVVRQLADPAAPHSCTNKPGGTAGERDRGEIDKFLEKCNFPKLKEAAESLNRPITLDEIETVIKKLLTHKSPGPDGFTGEFYRAFKGELTSIFHRLFQKIQEDGRIPNSCNEENTILVPKPDKDITKKENFRPISLMNIDAKNPQQNIGKLNPAIYQKDHTP